MEKIEHPKILKYVCLNLTGHASLWRDNIKVNQVNKGKEKIKTWEIMASKLIDKFLPNEYMISVFRKLPHENMNPKYDGIYG